MTRPDDPARRAVEAHMKNLGYRPRAGCIEDAHADFMAGWAECAKRSAEEIEGWKNGYANLITENDRIKNSLRAQVACLREGLERVMEGGVLPSAPQSAATRYKVMLAVANQALARAKELEGGG